MHGSAILTFPALSHVREALRGRSSREHADVDHANGTKRNYRAKSALTGGLRAFHRAPGATPPRAFRIDLPLAYRPRHGAARGVVVVGDRRRPHALLSQIAFYRPCGGYRACCARRLKGGLKSMNEGPSRPTVASSNAAAGGKFNQVTNFTAPRAMREKGR
jgi:hypothetical protein